VSSGMNKTRATRVEAPSRRLDADTRQRELVRAAYDILAARGFEGLRTRDVAARAGVNIATLHYHFPAKEDLIRAVATFLAEVFYEDQAPEAAIEQGTSAPLRALRREFENSRYWRRERPEMMTVSREFALRALRDSELRIAMERNNKRWRVSIEDFLARGVAEGVFRSDANVPACATVLMGFMWGAAPFLDVGPAEFDAACSEFEKWLCTGAPAEPTR
jgi:AcrR family transcriptional regulator